MEPVIGDRCQMPSAEREVVQDMHLMPLRYQMPPQGRTNEPRPPCDQDFLRHGAKVAEKPGLAERRFVIRMVATNYFRPSRATLSAATNALMRISIVIPCYNAESCVQRAVESALAQTHSDLEVICVDDGSSDGTLALLERIREQNTGRFHIIQQSNQGACAARNKGSENSSGLYIEFLDADDELKPGKLAHQAGLAQDHALPDLIIGSSITRAADGSIVETDVQKGVDRDPWLDLMRHKLGGTPQNLWKRDAVVAAGGWNVAMRSSQEYDLMFRMIAKGARIVHDDVILTEIHRLDGGSISRSNLDRNWERFVQLRASIIDHLRTERPETDLGPHYQVLFDSIRTLYPYAPDRAVHLYKSHLPKDFHPRLSPATGKGYLMLHHLLGFSAANRIRQIIARSSAN